MVMKEYEFTLIFLVGIVGHLIILDSSEKYDQERVKSQLELIHE
jgi:hypothetical protein